MIRTLIFFMALFLSIHPGSAQNSPDLDAVFSAWNTPGHPGGSYAIIKNGVLEHSGGFGLASLEYDVPITDQTIFNIASVSKQFTAFSIILLAQEGKLSLDDDIRKYVPEVPDFGSVITIRHLVHHISGLRNFQNLLTMAGWREGDRMTNDDLLKYISWQRDLNFPVGSEHLYCNTGYNLMATIVERVTGQSFIEWTRANMFEPLGMLQSEFRNDMTEVMHQTATSYDAADGDRFSRPIPFWDYMGNGNLYTNVIDLSKWVANFSDHKLGGKEAFDQLTQRGVLTNGDTISYAFGIGVGHYRDLSVIQHGGAIGGYRSSLAYFPEQDLGIVVLTNFSSANVGQKVWALADIVLNDVLTPREETVEVTMDLPTDPVELSPEQLIPFVGQFDFDDFMVEVLMEENQLMARASGSPPLKMTPTSDTSFYLSDVGYHVVFLRDENGEFNALNAYTPELDPGIRIFPELRRVDHLHQYVGIYYSPELKTSYTASIEGEKLMMRHHRHDSFELFPLNHDELSGDAWFFNDIKVVRNALGEVAGFRVSNGRVRDLLFEKSGI